ncbi:DsbA family oxidoreductase [Neisseria yangbaofengii]|uniref:DsbA family oxidoreductase n=1 Tax=Neisseria yangbaofengii TaxID=2709396 RepID=UPI0013ED13F3|nr:DsbA family oxidoreductase [Neisseria yangbaofengii]
MKIEIWSDYACPFCYVAKRHFEQALAEFAGKDDVQIVHKTFRLDPNAGDTPSYSMLEKLQKNYGKSRDEAVSMMKYINQAGERAGVEINVENTQNTNTLNAHRLLKFAENHGLGEALNDKLYFAYFAKNQNLADKSVLADLAEQIGLNRDESIRMLSSDEYVDECLADEQEARQKGIQAVPMFVFDKKYGVSGAQPRELFLQALTQSYDEHQAQNLVGASCGIDGCE